MALSRRHSRPITVDGLTLRWAYVLRTHPTGDYALVAAHATTPGARLLVFLPWRWPGRVAGHQGHRPLPNTWVDTCLRAALRHGWQPTTPGPELHLTLTALIPDAPPPPVPRAG